MIGEAVCLGVREVGSVAGVGEVHGDAVSQSQGLHGWRVV